MISPIRNYINGQWMPTSGNSFLEVCNPATGQTIAQTPAGNKDDVLRAAEAAHAAAKGWRSTPASQRIQYLYHMKQLLEAHADELAEICTNECGKTFAESKAEIVRAVENIEVASGIPILMQGEFSEDIASGIDEFVIRQPLGVGASITPFNFPLMVPFWFMPYALACGNTYIVKPSEKVPMSMTRVFELFEELHLPKGVLNMVQGGKETVDALLDHPQVRALSFVGSTPVARYIYQRGAANGKRVQAQGGAKNAVVIMPDADVDTTVKIIADSAFGCAGQRCLAASLVVTVGEAGKTFTGHLIEAAKRKMAGCGMEPQTAMGPVITGASKERIEQLIQRGIDEGAKVLLDGRNAKVPGYEKGFFLNPTVMADLKPEGAIHRTEIFGPVLGLMQAKTIEEAIELVNDGPYGNAASIFTRSGAAARKFRYEVQTGNVGINIGIAAPMAYFPFSGWKESFFGDLHGQARHAVEFYTQTKVVIERWQDEWSRKF